VVINTAPPAPAAPSVTIVQPTCSVATGSIKVTSPAGAGYTYSDGGAYQSSTTFSSLAAGTYDVSVKNSAGCISTAVGVVIDPASEISCSIGAAPCNDVYTGGIPTTIYLGYGPQSVTLIPTVEGGSSYTYSWTGSHLSCTTCAEPVFTPTAAGTFTFTVVVTGKGGCTSTCSITICVIDPRCGTNFNFCHLGSACVISSGNCATYLRSCSGDHLGTCSQVCGGRDGKDDGDDSQSSLAPSDQSTLDIKVYPNPFASQFHLMIISSSDETSDVKILDLTGQVIYERHQVPAANDLMFGDGMAAGIYFVQVIQGEQTKVIRIIKSE
jgi:hypothetical protein